MLNSFKNFVSLELIPISLSFQVRMNLNELKIEEIKKNCEYNSAMQRTYFSQKTYNHYYRIKHKLQKRLLVNNHRKHQLFI